jgi:hypothetical protein
MVTSLCLAGTAKQWPWRICEVYPVVTFLRLAIHQQICFQNPSVQITANGSGGSLAGHLLGKCKSKN